MRAAARPRRRAEFARLVSLTGGVEGPVLFTSFERHLPLARVLDKIGFCFRRRVGSHGIQWDAITDLAQRESIALQILQQVPVLWIWDNVEPVTGFPAGHGVGLERRRATGVARILASGARHQGKVPAHLAPGRIGMARRILHFASRCRPCRCRSVCNLPAPSRRGAASGSPNCRICRPLLRFTRGNPLTILVTIGEALRAGIDSTARLAAFVARLAGRGGGVSRTKQSEGRSKSLGASLSYGFEQCFRPGRAPGTGAAASVPGLRRC